MVSISDFSLIKSKMVVVYILHPNVKMLCWAIFENSKEKTKTHSLKQNYSVCQITEQLLFLQYKYRGAKAREKEECKRRNNIWNQSVCKRVMAGWWDGESRRAEERTEWGEKIDKKRWNDTATRANKVGKIKKQQSISDIETMTHERTISCDLCFL